MEQQPPPSRLVRFMESAPTYRLHLSENFEEYWRENGYFKTIRRVRNRCRDLTLETNSPGSAEWTIRNWEAKWRRDPAIADAGLSDRLLAAKYLESRGQYYTLQLSDKGTPIGGATIMVHHKVLVAGVLYRDPNYDHYGVGDRLIDLSFSFAAANGFETFDIGGDTSTRNAGPKRKVNVGCSIFVPNLFSGRGRPSFGCAEFATEEALKPSGTCRQNRFWRAGRLDACGATRLVS